MTEHKKDRPDLLVRRRPQPAPDERIDPVDVAPSPQRPTLEKPGTTETQTPKSKRRVPTVPIGPRLSADVVEVLDAAVAREGISQRQALEEAIISRWGQK